MNGFDLGTAWIQIAPSMDGLNKSIEKELGGVDTSKTGGKAGGGFAGAFGKVAKAGLIAAGVTAAAGLGAALTAGFGRLTAIENAEAKLLGLGNSAESVESIMENALAAVRGTAFGMDEAATTAAGAVAAGIKPGEDLERILGLVGDAATIAGVDMASMGSIFNKVATSDMMQMDVANQLMDAGIPILQMVADELGVTADEARKMASAGEISFETFASAMENTLGGAALKSGDTITGALSNLRAAFSRFGAEIMEPLMPLVSEFTAFFTDLLDDMAPAAAGFMEGLAPILSDTLGALLDSLPGLEPLFQGLGDVIMALAPVLPELASFLGELAGVVAGVLGDALTAIAPTLLEVASTLGDILPGVLRILTPILERVGDIFLALWPAIEPLVGVLLDLLEPLIDIIAPLIEIAVELAAPFLELAAVFLELTIKMSPLMMLLEPLIPILADLAGELSEWLVPAMESLRDITGPVIDAIGGFGDTAGDVQTMWAPVQAFIQDYIITPFQNIWAVVSWVFQAIQTISAIFWAVLSHVFQQIYDTISSVLGPIFHWLYENVVRPVWERIQEAIRPVTDWFRDTVVPIWDRAVSAVTGFFEGFQSAVETVWENVKKAAMEPVRFVVETVYRDGIKPLFDDIAAAVGLDERMPDPPNLKFASGGVLPGWSPGRDIHEFWSPTGGRLALSGGEAIMRPEFTAAVGGAAGIAALNAAARSGRLGGLLGGQAFADGGIWEAVGGTVSGAMDWLGSVANAVAEIVSDPLGAIDRLILEPVKGLLSGIGGGFLGDAIAEMPMQWIEGIKTWFSGLIAPTTAGVNGDWVGGNTVNRVMALMAGLPLIVTDTYRDPAYNAAVGGSPTSYHMDPVNPAIDVAGPMWAMDELYARVMANGPWRQVLWRTAGHWDHVHVAASGGVWEPPGAKVYDEGGYLQPGLSTIYNGTGKPEPVFTSDQWSLIEKMANGGGMPSELVVVDVDGELIGRMRVESANVTVEALRTAGIG